MTPTKDALETGRSSESQLSQAKNRTKPDSPHLRADAVSLEVPIKVHGSLVPNLAPGAPSQAQPFEEQTTTMIVFPQGGVLKMTASVTAGQMMVLTNLKSRQDAICRVIKVRAYGKTQSYVEVEFTNLQPAYWGVYFPTDGPEVARMAPPEQTAISEPAAMVTPEPPAEIRASDSVAPAPPPVSSLPASQPNPVVQAEAPAPPRSIAPSAIKPKMPESAFAAIGTKEDALPSASVAKVPRASSFVNTTTTGRTSPGMDSDISDAIDALVAPSLPAARTLPKVEMAELENSVPPIAANAPAARPVTTMAPKTAAEHALPLPKQLFGVELDSAPPVAARSAQGSGSKAIMFIGVAALLAVVAGGAYDFNAFHLRAAASTSAGPVTASASASKPAIAQNSIAPVPTSNANVAPQQIPDQSSTGAQPAATAPVNSALSASSPESDTGATAPPVRPRPADALPERRQKTPSAVVRHEKAATPSEESVAIPSTFGALNTRPVVNAQTASNSVGVAPALEPGGSPAPVGSALSSIAPPPSLAAPPKPASNAPVRVGGKVQQPRLISSVLPVYPQIAQQAGVTGTVVIETTVDKDGHVSNMRVVSGPSLLRNAALSALRKWKYEPSQLNGEPVAVQMVVAIQFR